MLWFCTLAACKQQNVCSSVKNNAQQLHWGQGKLDERKTTNKKWWKTSLAAVFLSAVDVSDVLGFSDSSWNGSTKPEQFLYFLLATLVKSGTIWIGLWFGRHVNGYRLVFRLWLHHTYTFTKNRKSIIWIAWFFSQEPAIVSIFMTHGREKKNLVACQWINSKSCYLIVHTMETRTDVKRSNRQTELK